MSSYENIQKVYGLGAKQLNWCPPIIQPSEAVGINLQLADESKGHLNFEFSRLCRIQMSRSPRVSLTIKT